MNSDDILKDWLDTFLSIFPTDKNNFLKKNKDSFTNPIRGIASVSLKNILDEILNDFDEKKIQKELDAVLRIVAIQEMSPSLSLSFILPLKKIIKKHDKKSVLKDMETKIEKTLFMAFDVFVLIREQIYKLRAEHVRNRTLNILERKNVLCEVPEFGSEIIPKEVFQSDAFQAELPK